MNGADPARPLLIYDGRCAFCRIWVRYLKRLTQGAVQYAPYQEAAASYPQIPVASFQQAVHLMLPDGETLSGARAVFALCSSRWPAAMYRRLPGFAALSEAAYRFIARRRNLFHHLTVLFFGSEVRPLTYGTVEWLFPRLLAIVYLFAFISFGVQASALIGSHGILPVAQYLARVREALGVSGFRLAPTLFWLNSGDRAVEWACIAGVVCGLLVLFGVVGRAALCGAFVLYLSLVNASQEFLSYQWDFLLLESGFLAIFLGYSKAVVWLFRWLLFRLMFFSGVVKLLSGDPAWRNLTALTFHYRTQPIPTPLAWYAQQMPVWFQKLSCAGVFFIEVAIPLFVLGPRRARLFALPWLIGLQLLILLTGNYAFFNLLALALCVFLLDDGILVRLLPRRLVEGAARTGRILVSPRIRGAIAVVLTIAVGLLSGLLALQTLFGETPSSAGAILGFAAPFGIVNSYGLFANMTTSRNEIIVEGSNDGAQWRPYESKYKPGALNRRPPWVAPYQPRLDWQMWFAALGSYRENLWFLNFVARLLQGRPEVLALLDRNPFPGQPPRVIRAQIFQYQFTDARTRSQTGQWWTRKLLGTYLPPVSLDSLSGLPILQGSPH